MRVNETLFINKIKRTLPNYSKNVVVGVGDDAAVVKTVKGKSIVITCDSQVEGVHFTRGRTNFVKIRAAKLGQRAVAVALSDIAAMGGKPKHILVSLVVPPPSEESFVHLGGVYKGFMIACQKYGVDIIGGNISRGPLLAIDIFVLGEINNNHIIRRSEAKVGDVVLVTGKLGRKAMVPTPRLKEGLMLAQSGVVTSMIDISDGLSTDLLHICDESRVGVRIYADKLPIESALRKIYANQKYNSIYDLALNAGEDYELCLTASRASAEKISAEVTRKTGTAVTIIGEILDKREGRWIVDSKGQKQKLVAKGWDHLRNF